jgi:hypothetical protein
VDFTMTRACVLYTVISKNESGQTPVKKKAGQLF